MMGTATATLGGNVKSYKTLLSQIQKLQQVAEKRRKKEVGAVIADIRRQMAEYGITLAEIRQNRGKNRGQSKRTLTPTAKRKKAGAKKRRTKRVVPPKYRDPQSGATWSGRGLAPKWLAALEKKGRKREEFLIKK